MTEPVQLTDEEVLEVDNRMNDHMHGHAISNSPPYFSCDARCRQQALGLIINDVLKKKFEDDKT